MVESCWRLVSALVFQASWVPFYAPKRALLRCFGANIGNGVLIKPRVTITFPWKLSIGDFSWIGENVWIDNLAEVSIGEHSVLSQGVYVCTGNHDYKRESFDLMLGSVQIASHVWVGAQVTLAPGVSLAKGCVISLGSTVFKNCEEGMVYSGNPAQVVSKR